MLGNIGEEIHPTKHFYKSFRTYKQDRKFYFFGFIRGNSDIIKVQVIGRKYLWRIHKTFFREFVNQPSLKNLLIKKG